jgi:drug/metabolite transporter (DMT)-like permease
MNENLPFFGELVAVLTTLCWSIGIFPFTEAARRLGPNTMNNLRLLLALILLTLISAVMHPESFLLLFSSPSQNQWLWFGLSGIVGLTLGDYFGFTGFAILGTRLASVFFTLSPGWALLFGYVFLGETINATGMAGMVITAAGVAWVTLSKNETSGRKEFGSLERGIFMAILSSLCGGLGLVLAKKGMMYPGEGELSAIHVTWMRMVVGTGSALLFTLALGKTSVALRSIRKNKGNGIAYAVTGTIFGPVVGICLSMYTISLINVSVAQTIFSLMPVFVLPLSALFYREKITLPALAGALIAIAGVFILIWRDEVVKIL